MDWIGHRRDVSPAKTDYASASPEVSEASLLRLAILSVCRTADRTLRSLPGMAR